MKDLFKRLGKILGIIFALLLALIVVLFLVVQLPFVKDRILDRIVGIANDELIGRLEVGSLEGDLITHARLHDVVLYDARDRVVARIPSVELHYRLSPLIAGQFIIDRVEVIEPLAVLRRYEDETWNFALIAEEALEESEPGDFPLFVDQIEVRSAMILYADESLERPVPLQGQLESLIALLEDPDFSTLPRPTIRERLVPVLDPRPALGEEHEPFVMPAAGLIDELNLQAKVSILGQQSLRFELDQFEALAHLDSIARELVLRSDPLRGYYAPDLVRIEHEGMQINGQSGWGGLDLEASFRVSIDDLGNRSPDQIEGLAANLRDLRIDRNLIGRVAPELPLQTGFALSARIAGEEDAFRILSTIEPLDAPGEVDLSALIRPNLDTDEAPVFELFLNATNLQPHAYWPIDAVEARLGANLWVSGQGNDLDDLELSTRVALTDIEVNGYRSDLVYAQVRYDRGFIEARPVGILTPYLDLFASGVFDPSGTFSATARTTADADQAARAAELSEIRPTQADLVVDVTGSFDPDVDPFVDSIEQVQLTSSWDFRGFEAEDIRIASSQGSLDTGIVRRDAPTGTLYDADFRVRTQGRGLSMPELRLGAWTASGNGQGTLLLPIEEPLEALRSLDTRLEARASGLRADGTSVNDLRLQARITKRPEHTRRIGYSLDTNLAGLAMTDVVNIAVLATTLTGHLGLRPEADGIDMITDLSARGDLNAGDIVADAARIDTLTTTIDLAGPPTNLRGAIDARLEDIFIVPTETRLAALEARLALAPVRAFALEAQALRPDETVPIARLDAAGTYHEDLGGVNLTGLSFGTDRMIWAMAEPGRITARPERLTFESVHLHYEEQSISLDGVFRPRVSQELELTIAGLLIEDLRRGFYLESMIPTLEGRLDVAASLDGTHRRPRFRTAAQLADLRVDGEGPFAATLQARYADEELHLETLELSAFRRDLLQASARLPIRLNLDGDLLPLWERPLEGQARLLPFEFSDFYTAIPWLEDHNVGGAAAGELAMTGTVARPNLDMSMAVKDFAFQGDVGDDFLDIEDLTWEADLTYEPVVGQRGGLGLTSQIDWKGERMLDLQAAAPLPLARWLRQSIEEEEPDFDWDGDLLTLPIRLALQVPELPLQQIPLESARDVRLEGRVSVDIDLQGTIGDPRGHINLGLHTFGFDIFRDIYVDINTTVADRLMQVDRLRLEWDADEILVAEGTLPLPIEALLEGEAIEDLPGQFAIQLRELPIAKLSAFDYTFAQVRGTTAAYLTFDGTLREPHFEGRIGLFNTELGDRRLGTIAGSVRGANNRVEVSTSFCREYETLATAEADMPILLDLIELARGANPLIEGALTITARGERMDLGDVLPVRLLSTWVTDPDGYLDFFAQVSGTWEDPTATGHLTLEEGAVTLARFGRRFEAIEARLALDDENLHVRNVSLRDGPSSVNLEGTLRHELMSPKSAVFQGQARDFNLAGIATEFPVYVSANIDAQANLEADPQAVRVNIDALEVRLTDFGDRDLHPSQIHDDILVLRRNAVRTARDPRDLAELTALRENGVDVLNMKVDINVSRNSWVRHPNGDVNIRAELTADILGDIVSLSGQAEALRGEFEFLGRRFVVQESDVTLTGAVPPNPILQIEATHPMDRAVIAALGPPSVGEPRIIIRVTGTADAPRLELMSDPAMTDTEILFVLMTGRPPDRRDAGQEEGVAARALGAVSGLFFGMLQERVAGSLPLDVLRVETGARGFAGGRLEVGKYVTSDIFLAYRHEFGADEDVASNVVRGEYHFLPRSMLELIYTDRNEVSLNVFWDVY